MATSLARVAFIRSDLERMLPKYKLIRDCIEQNIKAGRELYLPAFLPTGDARADALRYDAYVSRAVFYDVTSRTLNGLTGQVFANDPNIELPADLDAVKEDANGNGVSLIQNAKDAFRETLAMGRCGLYIDYPITNGAPTSRAQLQQGEIKPTLNVYATENIINWRTRRRGAKHIYELIVLFEKKIVVNDDGFTTWEQKVYKVLKLSPENVYTIEIYESDKQGVPPGTANQVLTPLDASGKPLKDIPFTFIGADNNDSWIDSAPLLPMAELNIGHYRNSADYEEACFIVGQPTYVVSGLTEQWYKEVLKEKLNVGSRGGIALPVGATAAILQVGENTMAKEAMEHKEKQMVAIGARLVEQQAVQQTATQATINNTAETSELANIAKNVSAAFQYALTIAAQFSGSSGKIEFELNTEFAINRLTAQDQAQLIANWVAGAITFEEMRRNLTDSGIAYLDVAEAQTQLAAEAQQASQRAVDAAKAMAAAVPPAPIVAPPGKPGKPGAAAPAPAGTAA